jgi:hypothetical protein
VSARIDENIEIKAKTLFQGLICERFETRRALTEETEG